MKTCPRCQKRKKLTDFYKREANKPASFCKECFNSYCIVRWQKKKLKAIERFNNVCHDCHQSFHPNVYDFHHLYDNKDYEWAKLRLRKQSTIDKELDKCVMLCANCHRMRHV